MRTYQQFRIRLAPDFDAWLDEQAKINHRSKNAEATVLMEEARKGREKKAANKEGKA